MHRLTQKLCHNKQVQHLILELFKQSRLWVRLF